MTRHDPPTALLLGANLGDRRAVLERVAKDITAGTPITIQSTSPVYETEPVDVGPQPWFLNQILLVRSRLSPAMLLAWTQRLEAALGRTRTRRMTPRVIDIDLLLCGPVTCRTRELTLPHPALPRRRCILEPLAEVLPQWRHPRTGRTVAQMLASCNDPSAVIRLNH